MSEKFEEEAFSAAGAVVHVIGCKLSNQFVNYRPFMAVSLNLHNLVLYRGFAKTGNYTEWGIGGRSECAEKALSF